MHGCIYFENLLLRKKSVFLAFLLDNALRLWYYVSNKNKYPLLIKNMEDTKMSRIKTIATKDIAKTVANGGCGECQTSCQSACKTSCGVANQQCENSKK